MNIRQLIHFFLIIVTFAVGINTAAEKVLTHFHEHGKHHHHPHTGHHEHHGDDTDDNHSVSECCQWQNLRSSNDTLKVQYTPHWFFTFCYFTFIKPLDPSPIQIDRPPRTEDDSSLKLRLSSLVTAANAPPLVA